jgi:hypothetical protein
MLSVAIPVALDGGAVVRRRFAVMREADRLHIRLPVGTAAILVRSVVLAAAGGAWRCASSYSCSRRSTPDRRADRAVLRT